MNIKIFAVDLSIWISHVSSTVSNAYPLLTLLKLLKGKPLLEVRLISRYFDRRINCVLRFLSNSYGSAFLPPTLQKSDSAFKICDGDLDTAICLCDVLFNLSCLKSDYCYMGPKILNSFPPNFQCSDLRLRLTNHNKYELYPKQPHKSHEIKEPLRTRTSTSLDAPSELLSREGMQQRDSLRSSHPHRSHGQYISRTSLGTRNYGCNKITTRNPPSRAHLEHVRKVSFAAAGSARDDLYLEQYKNTDASRGSHVVSRRQYRSLSPSTRTTSMPAPLNPTANLSTLPASVETAVVSWLEQLGVKTAPPPRGNRSVVGSHPTERGGESIVWGHWSDAILVCELAATLCRGHSEQVVHKVRTYSFLMHPYCIASSYTSCVRRVYVILGDRG